jgi:hypothetical protein
LKVLAITGRGLIMDNMPLELLLERTPVQVEALFLGEGIAPPRTIPEHDVAVVAVCESDANQPLLAALQDIADQWPRPIVNAPARIAQLSRERIGAVVAGVERLDYVPSKRVSRQDLASSGIDCLACSDSDCDEWIIRPVNTHAGHGLERVKSQGDIDSYLARHVAGEYFTGPYINYQSSDGKFRKYRVALISGRSFPVHMALSRNWMVHYLNADMLDNAGNRQEEAAFMQRFDLGFGLRHRQALRGIAERIGLDYVVLDCAESPQGNLLLFEADNGAVVHAMDSAELFPYKIPAMHEIFEATLEMLQARSEGRLRSEGAKRARAA